MLAGRPFAPPGQKSERFLALPKAEIRIATVWAFGDLQIGVIAEKDIADLSILILEQQVGRVLRRELMLQAAVENGSFEVVVKKEFIESGILQIDTILGLSNDIPVRCRYPVSPGAGETSQYLSGGS